MKRGKRSVGQKRNECTAPYKSVREKGVGPMGLHSVKEKQREGKRGIEKNAPPTRIGKKKEVC